VGAVDSEVAAGRGGGGGGRHLGLGFMGFGGPGFMEGSSILRRTFKIEGAGE
jgi:hypothetical protein